MKRAVLLACCVLGCARLLGFEEPTLDAGALPPVTREPCFDTQTIETEDCEGGKRSRICRADGWSSFSACAAEGWRDLPEAPIAGRMWHSAIWTGDELIVWGGQGTEGPLGDGAAYDPVKNSWRVLAPAPLGARVDHGAVWTGKEMIVWGGRSDASASSTYFADGASYDPHTNTWERLPGSPLTNRARPAAVWSTTTNEVLLWGGVYEFDFVASDGAAYDPAKRAWTILPTTDAKPRAVIASSWSADHMNVVYGECKEGTKCHDAWSYNPSVNEWLELAAGPSVFTASSGSASASRAGLTALFGGQDASGRVGNGVLFFSGTKTWREIPKPTSELGPVPERTDATAWWADGKLAVYGGIVAAGFDDHLATYDLTSWAALPSPGLGPRSSASATRSHDDVFVFGGRHDDGTMFAQLANGRIYRVTTPDVIH
jgi:N-acetylneuraminic acid mutarotase